VFELGEGSVTSEKTTDGSEALVEPSDEIEGERAVGDGFPEIAECCRHTLELPGVVRNGLVALDEVAELDVELDDAGFPVPMELVLQSAPDGAGGGVAINGSFGEVGGDGASDPGLHHTVHAHPIWEGGRRKIGEGVGLQRVLADDEEDLVAPAVIVAGGEVEDDVDEVLDVLHVGRLGVQMNQGGGLVCEHGEVQRIGVGAGFAVDGGVVLHILGVVVGVGNSFSGDGTRGSRLGVGGANAFGGVVALLRGEGGLLLGGFGFSESDVALGLEGLGALDAG
jgi:hypothetical protein